MLKSPRGKEVIPSTGAVDTVDAKNTTATEAMTRFLWKQRDNKEEFQNKQTQTNTEKQEHNFQ